MKRVICFIVCCVFFVGCGKQNSQAENSELDIYSQIKNELVNQKNFDNEYPYKIRLVYNFVEDKYLYDIIIDNVKVDMFYIKAIAYGTENDNQICPNIGIFNDEIFHLKNGVVDKINHFYKGIQLSGTIKNKQTIKVYVGYYSDKDKTKYIENYIEVNDEIR